MTGVFTIPPGTPFLAALARQILHETEGDPLALSQMLILLPTRRAARSLREAFLALTEGRPLLLPRMRPIGDVEEDEPVLGEAGALDLPPAISDLRRRLLLARLIMGMRDRGGAPGPEQAVALAQELARLLDQVHTERTSFDGLRDLVPADYAEHWQITLEFLAILTEHWPRLLAAEGAIDAADARNRLLEAQAAAWQASPPPHPIIAAGSTGSLPATARLLDVIAALPQGRVVLPGLDRQMDEDSRNSLDPTHPQYGMHRLLVRMGLDARTVPLWPGTGATPRAGLIAEAMRPPATTDAWRSRRRDDLGPALAGLSLLECPGPREEAGAIALRLRAALEEEGRTAALVTPDRELARRVAAALRRFGIEIDDSAGRPLTLSEPGAFLLLTASMVAEAFAPHATLAALKHPLAAGGISPAAFRAQVRRFERAALRGPRPAPGVGGLKSAARDNPSMLHWLDGLERMAAPFIAAMAGEAVPLRDLAREHVAFAERLAADAELPGAARLWAGDAGSEASAFLLDLADAADALEPLPGHAYPGLLRTLMESRAVRPVWGRHPRLAILGPLEARLLRADLVILGGLNEDVWPPGLATDPWMSRPMRKEFGLPPPEWRVGLSAHDFAQAFCAPEVVLTRSLRAEGAPTVPSRWLLRLEAVLAAAGLGALPRDHRWVAWGGTLDRPEEPAHERPQPPAPRPPVAARPRELSVTAVEMWRRDPYALYARKILGLEALDPIDADPDAADYGTIVHAAIDAFLGAHPEGPLPPRAYEVLVEAGRVAFGEKLDRPGIWAFWWPRFLRIARWFVAHEAERRSGIIATWHEVKGSLVLPGPAGAFRLTAKADRLDQLTDRSLLVIDYKTGSLPTVREIHAGYAPQLPLEAAIAAAGGFVGIPALPVGRLLFWRMAGGTVAGEERDADPKTPAADLAQAALAGLVRMVETFDDPATPYQARPHPAMAPRYTDYLHLARVAEWSGGEGGSGE